MARAATDDWLRTAAGLTVSPTGHNDTEGLAVAEAAASSLVAVARALPPCPTHGTGSGVTCRFAGRDQGERLCRLAPRLAALATHAPTTPSTPEQFVGALKQAVSAVYLCRRVRHTSGTCWFHARGDARLCGEVLAVAHRL